MNIDKNLHALLAHCLLSAMVQFVLMSVTTVSFEFKNLCMPNKAKLAKIQ